MKIGVGVVIGCMLVTAITSAIPSTFSLLHIVAAEEMGWSRAAAASALSFASLASALAAPAIGAVVDRHGALRVLVAGVGVVTLALAAAAATASLWHFYLIYGVGLALGMTMAGSTSQKTLISSGFEGYRGMVFGLTMSGAGLGTVALVPLTQWMLAGWGWRFAYLALAAISAFVFLELLLLAGASFWKRPPPQVQQVRQPTGGPSFRRWHQALFGGNRPTQLVMICSFFSGFQRTIVIVHLIPHLARAGHNPAMAVGAFVVGDLLRSFSSPIAGFMTDRFGSRATYLFSTCTAAVTLLLFNLGVNGSATTLYGIATLYGLASGGIQPSSATIQGEVFPALERGRMFGTTNMQYNLGSAASAWLGAWIYDVTGDYRLVILLASVSLVIMATTATTAATLVRRQAKLDVQHM